MKIPGALGHLRIVELGNMASAAYATKVLADLGADVIKVEAPSGDVARQRGPFLAGLPDPEASGLFLHLNANKRSIALDLTKKVGRRRFERLILWSDVLIHNYEPRQIDALGLHYDSLRLINPCLVQTSITPFGLTGPHAGYRAYELNIAHGGGWGWLSPGAYDRADHPPLKAYGHQCAFQAGLVAATVSLAAFYRAHETGSGEQIDISAQEVVASFVEQNIVHYTYAGKVASRLGRWAISPAGLFPCVDGEIYLVVPEQDQWLRLVDLMGNPEWATWDIFKDPYSRGSNSDVLEPLLTEWTRGWKVAELYTAGQESRICFAPVYTMAHLEHQEHLTARDFFVDVTHPRAGTLLHLGAPYRMRDPLWAIRRPAPLLGENNRVRTPARATPQVSPANGQPVRPLAGIRVADFGWVWAGPFAALQLAHLGAEVIKVESHARIDLGRRFPIFPPDLEPGVNRSGYFNQWNQGKKSFALDLKREGARQVALDLIAKSDVLIENFGAGVMERLGLGYADAQRVKPDIIYASISGYGQTGPMKDYMAYGPAIVPLAGLASLTGYAGGPPQTVGISYGDPNGAMHAAVAICAALVWRQRTRKGQCFDVSLWESMLAIQPEGWMDYAMNGTQPPRIGNRDPLMAPHNCYPCAGEDDWITIACGTEDEWRSLCQLMGRFDVIADPRFATARDRKANEDELDSLIGGWTSHADRWELTRHLQAAGVAAFPSMSSKDLVEDKHLSARHFFVRLPHPEVGARVHAGIPWKLTHSPNGVQAPAPLLGQHTEEIARDVLGYSEERIESLRQQELFH